MARRDGNQRRKSAVGFVSRNQPQYCEFRTYSGLPTASVAVDAGF